MELMGPEHWASSMQCRISGNTPPKAECFMSSPFRKTFIPLACLLLSACQREKRDLQPAPTRLAIYGEAARESALRPGGPVRPQPTANNPYNGSGYDIAEGQ